MAANIAPLVRAVVREGRELGTDEAGALFAALLAGDVATHELAAILAACRGRRASLAEMAGLMRALDAHTGRLDAPHEGPRPVVLPAFRGTHRQANLTALLALLLRRYETPVLVHGFGGTDAAAAHAAPDRAGAGPARTADVFWELGIEPATTLADAQARLEHDGIVFVPTAVLAPGLARLLASSPPPSLPATADVAAMLIDPFGGEGYRVIGAASADDLAAIREFLVASRTDALLFPGVEGEPFVDPRGQPRLEHVARGVVTPCADADAEADGVDREPPLPSAFDASTTATWIADVLAGTQPVPPPIVMQLGCCLAGARRVGAEA